jgi:hypothetical protein
VFGEEPEIMISGFHGTDLAEDETLLTDEDDVSD